ncbi:MAG: CmcI family methyltransferase [Thermodesulfobacteriota bacterium]
MKIRIDTAANSMVVEEDGVVETLDLFSREGLEKMTGLWIKQQWNAANWRSLSWLGFPIWQLPDDMIRLQESLFRIQPDVIVETGVNQGGSAIFFASLCRLLGKGRVISIDVHIPESVRKAVAESPYGEAITLIQADSAAPDTVRKVRDLIRPGERTFVFLDSDHSRAHVLRELNAYAGLVSVGSYIVAADGVMRILSDTPEGAAHWREDNPAAAAREFAALNPNFIIQRPAALYGEEYVIRNLTYCPDGWLLRRS